MIQKILLIACLFISACSGQAQQSQAIPAATFKQKLDKLPQSGMQLIDVRTPEEYKEGYIPHAVNIDIHGADFQQRIKSYDTNKPVFVYCLSGGRSAQAMDYLVKAGFKEVYNLQGGILQWKAANYPLAGAKPTQEWIGMTREAYQELIHQKVPVVIDFNARWCGPCKQLKPILEEIQKEYEGKINIIPIDIDQHKSLARSLYVNQIPLLVLHQEGEIVANLEGFTDKQGLLKFMRLVP